MNLVNHYRPSYPMEQLRPMLLSHKLIKAAQIGHFAAVSQLVERHFTPVNYQNCNEGTTALGAAVVGGFLNIVKYLVEHGADVNLANLRGETPLHLSVLSDNVDIISFLLLEGSWLESEDECGDTPLMYATREDRSQAVEVLLMHGADPDHPNEDNETPAMLAEEVASFGVRDLFATFCSGDLSNASSSAAVGPDGIATGAPGSSYEMKVHFPLSKGIPRRSDAMTDDSDSCSGSEDASVHSGSVHSPPLASLASKHLLGVPRVLTAGMDRPRFAFLHPSY